MNNTAPGASAPIVFTFRSTQVRTVVRDGEVWFVASDVAKALAYGLATDMTRNLDEDEKGMQIVHTPSGDQEMIVINESGMYHAVLKSRKPEAKPFRKWVTGEVLPAIRKTGHYEAQPARPALPSPAFDPRHALQAIRDQLDALSAPQRPEPRAQLCALLETTNDLGIWYLLGKAEEVAKEYPRQAGRSASR